MGTVTWLKKPLTTQEDSAPLEMRLTPQNKKEWYAALYKRAEENLEEYRRMAKERLDESHRMQEKKVQPSFRCIAGGLNEKDDDIKAV